MNPRIKCEKRNHREVLQIIVTEHFVILQRREGNFN